MIRVIIFLLFISFSAFGKNEVNTPIATIPFQFINNTIVIQASINESAPLYFIVDTGSKFNIIVNENQANFRLTRFKEIQIGGLGEGDHLAASFSQNCSLKIDSLHLNDISFLILHDALDSYIHEIGLPIYGVLGNSFFLNHLVKIDYSKREIALYNSDHDLPKKVKRNKIPLQITNGKPFIQANISYTKKKSVESLDLLLDTGGSFSIWLKTDSTKSIYVPDNSFPAYLGKGFNGDFFGQKAQLHQLYIGKYKLSHPECDFPDATAIDFISKAANRNGSIGNEVLRRFDVYLNYSKSCAYLRKNNQFFDKFRSNNTGIVAQPVQIGTTSEQTVFIVEYILENSPAENAGLQAGDVIQKVNSKQVKSLSELNKILIQNENFINIDILRKDAILSIFLFKKE